MTYSRKTGGGGGGGYAPGGTDVAVEDGGTGASTAAAALANLGGLPLSLIDAADDLIVGSADNTAARLAVAASRIIGKKATGGIGALTPAEVQAILSLGVKTSKPAANITKTGTTLGSFSTAWTVAVTAAAGQVVVVRACVAANNSTDQISYLALAKGGTVLIRSNKQYSGGEPRTSITMLEWVDEAPSVGTNTYEVYGATSGGTQTVYGGNTLDTTTAIGFSSNSVLTAEVRNPL